MGKARRPIVSDKSIILFLLVVFWIFSAVMIIVPYLETGGFERAFICVPFVVILTVFGLLVWLLFYLEEKRAQRWEPGFSTMYVAGLAMLMVCLIVYVLMTVFLIPEFPDRAIVVHTTCTPFVMVAIIMLILFLTYELRKPWGKKRLHTLPSDSKSLKEFYGETFFEPKMDFSSKKSRRLRRWIIILVGTSISLGLGFKGSEALIMGELVLYDPDSWFPRTFWIVTLLMIAIIILFVLYWRSMQEDWDEMWRRHQEMVERYSREKK